MSMEKAPSTIDEAEYMLLHSATMNSMGIIPLPAGNLMYNNRPCLELQKALQKTLVDRSLELIDVEAGMGPQGLIINRVFLISMLGRARLSQLRATAKGGTVQ